VRRVVARVATIRARRRGRAALSALSAINCRQKARLYAIWSSSKSLACEGVMARMIRACNALISLFTLDMGGRGCYKLGFMWCRASKAVASSSRAPTATQGSLIACKLCFYAHLIATLSWCWQEWGWPRGGGLVGGGGGGGGMNRMVDRVPSADATPNER